MSYNHTRNYFYFQGKRYGIGTIVKIKPEQYGCGRNIERCNGVAKFEGGLDSGYIKFSGIVPLGEPYCGIGWVASPEDKIEKIIDPVYYEDKPTWQIAAENYANTPKHRRADISPGTVLYLAAMLVGALFKGAIFIWIIATLIYLSYVVNIYRD